MVFSPRRKLQPDPLRPLNVPRPLRVTVGPHGEPRAVEIAARMRAVTDQRDCWRIEDRWWTEEPIDRTYYELELEGGEVTTLFYDRLGNSWFEQRVK